MTAKPSQPTEPAKEDHSLEEQVMLFQLLQKHAEQIQQQGQAVQQKLIETLATEQAVSDLGKGSEALVPLGSGVFVQGTAGEGLLLNIGSGIFLPSTPGQVATHLAKAKTEIEQAATAVNSELQRTAETLQELATRIQAEAVKRGMVA